MPLVPNIDSDSKLLFLLFLPMSIVLPNIWLNENLNKSSFDLITINNIDEIVQFQNQKYFEIKEFHIPANDFFRFEDQELTRGKSNRLQIRNIFFSGIFSDSIRKEPSGIVCIIYDTSFYSRIQYSHEISKITKAFKSRCSADLTLKDFQKTKFFERQFNSDDATFLNSIWESNVDKPHKDGENFILVPFQKPWKEYINEDRAMILRAIAISIVIAIFLMYIKRPKTRFFISSRRYG